MNKMTPAELLEFNGLEGKPTYIAYEGNVYDVSTSKKWIKGKHMMRHSAGVMSVNELKNAPHGPEVLERFPAVAALAEDAPAAQVAPLGAPSLRERLKPFEWPIRHGHPMTVHYPIAFMMGTSFFVLLYLLTGYRSFETTSFYLMLLGLVASPAAMTTGLIAWWYTYNAELFFIIRRKMQLSVVLAVVGLIMVIWRATTPDVLTGALPLSWLYILLTLLVTPLVMLLGYYGGKLTFG